MQTRTNRILDEMENSSEAVAKLVGLATVTAFAAALHPYLDWVCQFRAIYLAGALVALPALTLLRNRWAIVAAGCVALNMWCLAPYAPTPQKSGQTCEPTITSLSINAYGDESDHDQLLELIVREDPDVMFVSELREPLKDKLAAKFPHHVWRPKPYHQFGFFSKFPIDSGNFILAPNGRPTINAVVEAPGGKVRVLAAHPTSPGGYDASLNRNVMLEQIAEAARDSPEPVLLIGDLNVTMFSPHYEQIEDAGMTNARAGRGVQPTWPDWSPVRIPIDHVLVSDEFEVCEMEVLDSFGSDHLPVLATVRMD